MMKLWMTTWNINQLQTSIIISIHYWPKAELALSPLIYIIENVS